MGRLVERDDVLSAIAACAEAACAEAAGGRSLLVRGQLGAGRTALVHAAHLAHLADTGQQRVLRATADPSESDVRLGVVHQLLDPVLARATEAEREAWLAAAPGLEWSMMAGFTATTQDPAVIPPGLYALVTAVAQAGPLLLLVDDLHWSDPGSLRWLGYLNSRPVPRVSLVATLRDGEAGADGRLLRQVVAGFAQERRLAPLTGAGALDLARDRLGEAVAPELVRACHLASGGNPLLLTSLLTAAVEEGEPSAARPGAPLRERMASYLRGQRETVVRLLRALVVLEEAGPQGEPGGTGTLAGPAALAALAGLDEVDLLATVQALRAQGVLAPDDPPRLAHDCLRTALADGMPAEIREEWHLRAAALLHDEGLPACRVAAHLLAVANAGAQRWVVDVLRAAADAAVRRGARDEAVRYLRRALLDLPSSGEARAAVLSELAAVELVTDPVTSVRHVTQAVSLLTTPWQRGVAVAQMPAGGLATTRGHVVELVESITADLAGPGRPEVDQELAILLEARVRYARNAGSHHLGSAVRRWEELHEEDHLWTAGRRELLAVALRAATLDGSVPAERVVPVAHAVLRHEPAVAAHTRTALPALVCAIAGAGRPGDLTDWLALAAEDAAARADPVAGATIAAEQALLQARRGNCTGARAHLVHSLELLDGGWYQAAWGLAEMLAVIAFEHRDVALLEEIARRCGSTYDPAGTPKSFTEGGPPAAGSHLPSADRTGPTVVACLLRAVRALEAAQPQLALAAVLECGRHLERAGWRNPALFGWRGWAAVLHHALGASQTAVSLAEEELVLARVWGTPVAIGHSLRVLASVSPPEERIPLLREAVALLTGTADEAELARAHLALAAERGLDGSGSDAAWWSGRLAEVCWAAHGTPDLPGEGTPGATGAAGLARLTQAERRVVELAAGGSTNQAIAAELKVSSRAVEKHLTNSYRKLGVGGRAGLAAFVPGSAESPT